MSIHHEGYAAIVGTCIALFAVYHAIGYWGVRRFVRNGFAVAGGLFLCAVIFFFRNPRREIVPVPQRVLSPADGRVIAIEEVEEEEFFQDKRLKVSIFMSPLNVHLNRYPVAGKVCFKRHHQGQYLVAFHPKASKLNEHTTVVIERADTTQVLVRQIAGFLARRIRCYAQEGKAVQQGAELGFIKFGSRADIYLPVGTKLLVNLGDELQAGLSVVADMPLKDTAVTPLAGKKK